MNVATSGAAATDTAVTDEYQTALHQVMDGHEEVGDDPDDLLPEEDEQGFDLFEDEEEDEPPAPQPQAQRPAPTTPPSPTVETRLAEVAQRLGQRPEDLLSALDQFSANPQAHLPQPSEEEEVAQLLGQSPSYVQGYQMLQDPAAFATETERLLMTSNLERQVELTRLRVRQERIGRQQAETTRATQEREAVERVASRPEFARYLKRAEDRQALAAYARSKGLADMEVAARAFYFDRQHQAGRQTLERARRSSTQVGTPTEKAPPSGDALPPVSVIEKGLAATESWLRQNRPDLFGRRRK